MLVTEMNQCAAIAKVFVGHTALAQLSQSSSKLNLNHGHFIRRLRIVRCDGKS